jgi:hypothetical protein
VRDRNSLVVVPDTQKKEQTGFKMTFNLVCRFPVLYPATKKVKLKVKSHAHLSFSVFIPDEQKKEE